MTTATDFDSATVSCADERCTDAHGTVHGRAHGELRIASLVPSITELLFDLGLAEHVVARTGFCIHPRDQVRTVTKVGGTKDVDVAKLRELAPTHVIVNIDENRRELMDELEGFVPHIFVTHPLGPSDNLPLYRDLGLVFNADAAAARLQNAFLSATSRLEAKQRDTTQRVLYLIWRDPWMSISTDTYISRMLELIDWRTQSGTSGERYPTIRIEDFVGQVDRVLLSSEPYPFRDKHIAEVRSIFGPTTSVALVDGEMLSWYGSRAIAGLDYLSELEDSPA